MEISEYLNSKGFEWKRKDRGGKPNAIMNCPFCSDKEKKFAVNLEHGAFQCFHFNHCGIKGSFWDLQKKLGDKPQPSPAWQPTPKVFVPQTPKTYVKPVVKVSKLSSRHIQYLEGRGLSKKTIEFFKVGEKQGAMAFPYFKNKEVVGIKYRAFPKKFWNEKDSEPVLFNRYNIKEDERILLICEGEIDCMTMHEYGIDSVSVPNGSQDFRWLDNEWEWLQKFDGFHLCFDNDSAGIKGAEALAQKLGAWKCQRVILPFKDANECLKNKITAEVITDCLWEAIDFAPTDLVSPERFTDEIIQLIENPQLLNGTPTAWPKLNSLLGGWRMSELTVWSGQNGSGKSTIINQQVLDLLGKNNGVCIASLEMTPARYLRWMLLQKTHKQYPTASEVRQALAWMSDNLYLINSTDSMDVDVLLDIFKYAARRYNVKHFVIDSLMRINISGDDKWDAQKEFVAKLLTFGKKFQTHMHLVAHARKLGSDNDKPDKTAVKGSGDITDLAHNVLVMWRTPEDSRVDVDAVLSVRKNRELGLLGNVGLYFNPQTKSFYDETDKYEKTKQNTRRSNNAAPI